MSDYKIIESYMDTFDREIVLIQDEEGYSLYIEKNGTIFDYGVDFETAKKHFDEFKNKL